MLTIRADRISAELLQAGTDMRDGPTTPGCLAELDRVRPQAMGVTLAGLTERGLCCASCRP